MSLSSRPRGRGHPPTDIVSRLRSWIWYWMLKEATKQSDDELDRRYLPSGPRSGARPRLFERIRSIGSDPTCPRVDLLNRSIFERVHAERDPMIEPAREAFESPLWRMLSDSSMAIEDYLHVIAQIIAARGWYRASSEDRKLGLMFMRDDPAFGMSEDRANVYCTMLTSLESTPSADNIALLAALFREALAEVALEQATLLRSSLRACAALWVRSIELPDQLSPLFDRLVDERIVRNLWRSPAIPAEVRRSQRHYIRALIQEHLQEAPKLAGSTQATLPIVQRSPRIEWLYEHRPALGAARGLISDANAIYSQLSDSPSPESRERARAARKLEGDIYGLVQPPPRDLRYCLPVLPDAGVRWGNRPAPYLLDGTLDDLGMKQAGEVPALSAADWEAFGFLNIKLELPPTDFEEDDDL